MGSRSASLRRLQSDRGVDVVLTRRVRFFARALFAGRLGLALRYRSPRPKLTYGLRSDVAADIFERIVMKKIMVLGLLLAASLGSAQNLTVFAASSLTEAFEEIAQTFETNHEGVKVVLNFAGSSTLSTQIVQGAPADVFASADQKQMGVVAAAGLTAAGPKDFAGNKLVVITPVASAVTALEDLATPGTKVVLAAPEVPVGAYARAALENLNAVYGPDFKTRVEANLVSEEPNVRQAAAKVELGEADAAVVYTTDAAVLSNVRTLQIPDDANVLASYPIAVLKDAPQSDLAAAFVAFVLSDAGRAVLTAHGFTQTP